MRAESGENGLEAFSIILPRITRQLARAGVFAALVGWHGEHTIPLTEFRQALRQQVFQPARR
jgi:hypothetical protein